MPRREQYRRTGGWPVQVQVRVRRRDALAKPDNAAVWDVLDTVARGGAVPAGWEVAAVAWEGYRASGTGYRSAGWRHGDADDLPGLLAPMLAGTAQIGWERRTRRVQRTKVERWVRWRSTGTRTKHRGEWVSDDYARRYPHLVYVGQVEERRSRVTVTVTDWEAEVRVAYLVED